MKKKWIRIDNKCAGQLSLFGEDPNTKSWGWSYNKDYRPGNGTPGEQLPGQVGFPLT